jgi:N-acetylglucosamine-6-phosphate deacetylase
LIDLHIHGAFGVDVQTAGPEALDTFARGLAARGVTGFLPTLVPAPLDELAASTARLAAWARSRKEGDGRGALPLGIHFEGPFVAKARCGALHVSSFRDGATGGGLEAFLEAVGEVPGRAMATVAPEIPGGVRIVSALARKGWVVSLGHTDADSSTLDEARAAGARHMTHFGNAMRPLHHRELGPVGWGLLARGVTVDVIADLHHLSPGFLRLVLASRGASNVALISDAAPPAGLPDGPYEAWGERLVLAGGCVRNGAGALAGSAALLDECVMNLAALGLSGEEAVGCAREVPARILSEG